jgi:hypothetical protein
MDPTQTLHEVLEALDLRDKMTDDVHRAALATVVCVGLKTLREWTYEGGYPPDWPQRPLTLEECEELRVEGHRP